MSTDRIHLVRHGEVHNPDHIVYADLPGYGLSELGVLQATASGQYLARSEIAAIVASPLERAHQTALLIAEETGSSVKTDERLTEWRLSARWAGIPWEALPTARPGELEAYLAHPDDLDFSPESLADLAGRMATAIRELASTTSGGHLVVVSHQDPLHAARRLLSGEGFASFNDDKPGHAAVVALAAAGRGWAVVDEWEPPQGMSFPPRSG